MFGFAPKKKHNTQTQTDRKLLHTNLIHAGGSFAAPGDGAPVATLGGGRRHGSPLSLTDDGVLQLRGRGVDESALKAGAHATVGHHPALADPNTILFDRGVLLHT